MEERRLFYVASTRAKLNLFFIYKNVISNYDESLLKEMDSPFRN
jgi:superfamily I DNA/RNA helicase